MVLLFEGSGLLLCSLVVLLLFVATLALALYRDEFRDGAGKLVYVSRFGPLRVLTEYESYAPPESAREAPPRRVSRTSASTTTA